MQRGGSATCLWPHCTSSFFTLFSLALLSLAILTNHLFYFLVQTSIALSYLLSSLLPTPNLPCVLTSLMPLISSLLPAPHCPYVFTFLMPLISSLLSFPHLTSHMYSLVLWRSYLLYLCSLLPSLLSLSLSFLLFPISALLTLFCTFPIHTRTLSNLTDTNSIIPPHPTHTYLFPPYHIPILHIHTLPPLPACTCTPIPPLPVHTLHTIPPLPAHSHMHTHSHPSLQTHYHPSLPAHTHTSPCTHTHYHLYLHTHFHLSQRAHFHLSLHTHFHLSLHTHSTSPYTHYHLLLFQVWH